MATRMATPSTKPNWRPVFSTPEPTPRDLSGSEPMPAAVSAGMLKANPAPVMTMRQETSNTVASPSSCASSTRDIANNSPADGREDRRTDLLKHLPEERPQHEPHRRHRGDGQRRPQFAVAEDVDHVDDDEEDRAPHRRPDEEHRTGGRHERPDAEQAQVEHGRSGFGLPEPKTGQQDDRGHEQRDDAPRRPAPVVPLDEPEREREEGRPREDDARQVDARLLPGPLVLGDEPEGPGEGDERDGHVHVEDPVPGRILHEHAAERRPHGRRHRSHDAPQGRRHAVLMPGEGAHEDGQRHRHHGGRAEGLPHPEDDEPADVGRQAAGQREAAEHDDPEDEDEPLPVAVGKPPEGEEEDGQPDVVGVEHPGDHGDVGLEIGDHRRDGDVDDGRVEQGHEHAQSHHPQDEPLAGMALVQHAGCRCAGSHYLLLPTSSDASAAHYTAGNEGSARNEDAVSVEAFTK